MLRGFVPQVRSRAAAELEAMTAERDFFREKYIEQIDEIGTLRRDLEEARRVIDELRGGGTRPAERAGGAVATPKRVGSSGDSVDTSVTCTTCDDDLTPKSDVENTAESGGEVDNSSVGGDNDISPRKGLSVKGEESRPSSEGQNDNKASCEEFGSQEEKGEESKLEMEALPDAPSKSVASNAIVYSLPMAMDKKFSFSDDDSTQGSTSREHPNNDTNHDRKGRGSIERLFKKWADMVDPPSESDSEGGNGSESIDGDSH